MVEFGNPIIGLEELIRSAIRSQDYETGVSGWRIARDGTAEFASIFIRGSGVGDIIIIGPIGEPQVHIGSAANFGYIEFPTNGPVENFVARIISARGNADAVNEYASMQIGGPSVDGAGATDRITMLLNSQNNDGSSNANWSVTTLNNGSLIIADKDEINFIPNIDAPNYPSEGWTSFTPTWTTSTGANTPSFGNAVLDCKWNRAGRTITAKYEIVFGTTTNFGAAPTTADNWRFTLPVTASDTHQVGGFFELNQSTGRRCIARGRFTTTGVTELEVASGAPDGAAVGTGLADSLTPWTWANGNAVRGILTYEAAS